MVEAMPGGDAGARQASASELSRRIKNLVGVSATITVTDPGGVERSQGKARRVVDKRPQA